MLSNALKIAIVIPALNESGTIENVISNLKSCSDFIIVVDDGSVDGTGAIAVKNGAYVIKHEFNKGYEKSIEDGFKKAVALDAGIIVTFDADGQHKSEYVSKALKIMELENADIVVGQRNKLTHFSEKVFALYTNRMCQVRDPLCGFKVYRRKVYDEVGHFDTLESIGTELMLEAKKRGFKIVAMPVKVEERLDKSRFYSKIIKGNYKIFRALFRIIIKDLRSK